MVLAQSGDASTYDMLVTALNDEDRRVRAAATYNLGRLGDLRAVAPLIAALDDESSAVRGGAASALGWLHDARAVEPLIQVLLKDDAASVRMNAAFALEDLGDERALPALEWARQHDKGEWRPGDTVKEAATNAIEHIRARNSPGVASPGTPKQTSRSEQKD